MGQSARDAGCFMRAAMTLAPELKTIGDFTAFLFSELTAIGAGLFKGQTALRSAMLISKASIRYSFAAPRRS